MHTSLWEQESFYSHKQVIIIGAGLAGLWSAIELKKLDKHLSILIIEKGAIPQGASTRNAGFACFGSPTELLHDAQAMGESQMWQVVEMRYRGIEKIRKFLGDDIIGFDNCGGYELLGTNAGFSLGELDDKLAWLNKGLQKITGGSHTYTRQDTKLIQFKFNSFQHLIQNKFEGGIHSGKLVQALLKAAVSLGVEILFSTEATGWEKAGSQVKVYTGSGRALSCDKLLVCTNGFTASLIKNADVTPGRGQVLVTSPIPGLSFTGTFHFDEGFYYFRNVGNRVLLGGARNKAFSEEATTALETTRTIQQELERFLQEQILPGQTYTIECRWSGIMGFTKSKLPVIQEVAPSVYTLITCNGMGVALSPVMGEITAKRVVG